VTNEGNVQLATDHLHVVGVVGARGSRVVIDVMRPDIEPSFEGEQQEPERIGAARHGEVDGRPGFGKVTRAEQAFDGVHACRLRDDPAGPADPEVPVLVARSLNDHAPIAAMVVYSMHPTVLHEDSTLISGDFPHFSRAFLQGGALPAGCPVLYHIGTAGNQSPRHVTHANTFAEAQRLGELLGREIASAIARITYRSDVEISCRSLSLELTPRAFPSPAEADRAEREARARFDHLRTSGAPRQETRTAECDWFGAEETATMARAFADGSLQKEAATAMPMEIQVIEVGPWKFVAWPGEHFVEYGLAVKARSPNTFIITVANGMLQGYMVTAEAVAGKFYESANAVFDHSNGPRIVEATLKLLQAGK